MILHTDGTRKPHVLLAYVTPPGQDDMFIAMPLGILYLGAILRELGYPVTCLDERVSSEQEFREAIDRADVVGLSALTPHVQRALRWATEAKRRGKITMMGGPHVTVDPHTPLDSGQIDYGVMREAEESLPQVLRALGNPDALAEIEGLAFFGRNGQKIVTPERPLIREENLDKIPFPAWDMLPVERYFSLNRERLFYIFTSRGCPFRCVFCQKELTGRGFRQRSNENVLDELETIVKRYRPGNVLFIDELFTCRKKRVIELCQGILDRGLKLNMSCETRVDMIDEKMARLMKRAGFRRMYFGVEAANDRSLKTLKKDYPAWKVVKCLRMMRRVGIWTKVFLIVGTPGETAEDIAETEQRIREAHPDLIRISLFNPLTATASFQLYQDRIDPTLVNTEYVDSDRTPYMHEHFTNEELNMIRRRMIRDYERWYYAPRQRIDRWAQRVRYYSENPDEGWDRVKRALRLTPGSGAPELTGAGSMADI